MCKWGNNTLVRVRILPELSHTGRARWKRMQIDSCIAPIVDALQKVGINMQESCCGHGKIKGYILLEDGRMLEIKPPPPAKEE